MTWDNFWSERSADNNYWTNIVWKMGFEYWDSVFKSANGKVMLECGSGSSQVSLHMAQHGFSCTMLDNSPEGLKLGRDNFAHSNMKGKFVLADVLSIPFPSDKFDIVYSGGLLEHFKDVTPVFKEMVRVLKPQGILGADIIPKRFSCMSITYFLNSIRGIKRDFPFYENSISLEKYKRIARECGLCNVIGGGTGLFPPLPLPHFGHKVYKAFLSNMIPAWRAFDKSCSLFSAWWGMRYSIYGYKASEYTPHEILSRMVKGLQ